MTLTDEITADSPIGYWRTASGVDQSGNGHDLTPFGSPSNGDSLDLSDPSDPGILLGASSNLYDASNSSAFDLTTAVSMSFLMKPSSFPSFSMNVFQKNLQYGVYMTSDGKLHAIVRKGGSPFEAVSTTSVSIGTTYHVGMSYDGATLKLYLNGTLDGSLSTTGSIDVAPTASLTIGVISEGFAGIIDEAAVYGTALSAGRFAAHHTASVTAGAVTAYVAHYSGGTGNTDGEASLGGAIGATLSIASDALFAPPTDAERAVGLTDYRCVIMLAPADATTGLKVWLSATSGQTDSDEAIGYDASPAVTIANRTTAPSGVTFSSPTTSGTGLALGGFAAGAEVPIWIRRALSGGAVAGTRSFSLGLSWTGADSVARSTNVSVSYTVVTPVTLYVNADHGAADDTRLRTEAADDPNLPFATVRAAVWQLQAGDTCQVEPADNANPDDVNDTSVYAFFDAHNATPPAANSSAKQTKIIGHVVSGQLPKIHHWDSAGLTNWQIENIQFGYDRGSGFDHDTAGQYSFNYDLIFRNCRWTGGVWWVRGFGGLLWLDQCEVYHPNTQANFFSGVGMWVFEIEAGNVFPTRPGILRVTSSHFEDLTGEDAIQCSSFETGSRIEIGVNGDTGEVLGNTFKDLPQTTIAHTDGTQFLGIGGDVYIVGNRYINCASPIIASDGLMTGRVFIAKNLMGEASVWTAQFQGCSDLFVLHNTSRAIWGIQVYERTPSDQNIRIRNNIVPWFSLNAGDINAASKVDTNITYEFPGSVTTWGTNLAGFPEFGTSGRISDYPYELANSPSDSPGIGQAAPLTGLGLNAEELGYLADDFFGRPFDGDVGALQSDPGTTVTVVPRPPHAMGRFPSDSAINVDPTSTISIELLPTPGRTINASTVTSTTFFVAGPDGVALPVSSISVGSVDSEGIQTLTLQVDGLMLPWVRYSVHMDDTVADNVGLQVGIDQDWAFRTAGTSPAIDDGTGGGGAAGFWIVGAV